MYYMNKIHDSLKKKIQIVRPSLDVPHVSLAKINQNEERKYVAPTIESKNDTLLLFLLLLLQSSLSCFFEHFTNPL